MEIYQCYICQNNYTSLQNAELHLKLQHYINDENHRVKCLKHRGCQRFYTTFKGMREHTRKCNYLPVVDEPMDEPIQPNPIDDPEIQDHLDEPHNEIPNVEDLPVQNEDAFLTMKMLIMSVLKQLISLKLPKQLTVNIVKQLETLIFSIHELLRQYLFTKVPGYLDSEVSEYIDLFFTNILIILKDFSSEYLFNKNIRERNENYVTPVCRMIGSRWDQVYDKRMGRYIQRLKLCEYFYIPIKDTLERLFSNESFRNSLHNNHQCVEGVYTKFCCGELYKNSEYYQNKPNSIRLQLYYDDFHLTNSRNNQTIKMGAVYYTVENLPALLNSHVDHIHLLAIFHTIDLKNYAQNFNTILHPTVQEFNVLQENGIDVNDEVVHVNLSNYTGDNLALRTACGFFENFSNDFFCLHCKITKAESEVASQENLELLRSTEEYENLFQGDKTRNFPHIANALGVKHYTLLNDINNFDLFNHMGMDFMHDVIEGSIPRTIASFVRRVTSLRPLIRINDDIYNLNTINRKILDFDFGFKDKKNRPGEINLDVPSLGMSASQKLVLFLHFPIIFNELIGHPRAREYWSVARKLLGITKICLLRTIKESDLQLLEHLIKNYLEDYVAIFNEHLMPKQHFLVHYPRLIRKLGPPLGMSTMRYEQLHQTFKKIYNSTGNSINICMTLAQRYQEFRGMNTASYDFSYWKRAKEHNLSEEEIEELPAELRLKKKLRFVSRTNLELRDNCLFPLGIHVGFAHLGKLQGIYVSEDNDVYISFQIYETLEFHEDYVSYPVQQASDELHFRALNDFTIDLTFKLFEVNGQEFVLLMKLT